MEIVVQILKEQINRLQLENYNHCKDPEIARIYQAILWLNSFNIVTPN